MNRADLFCKLELQGVFPSHSEKPLQWENNRKQLTDL